MDGGLGNQPRPGRPLQRLQHRAASTPIGNFDLNGRDAWNSGGTRYYELNGANLVFQTGNHLGSGIGQRRQLGVAAPTTAWRTTARCSSRSAIRARGKSAVIYDAITYTGNVIDSLYTVNGNRATLNNGLAPWGGATADHGGQRHAFTVPQLRATGAMLPVQTGTRRDIVGGNGKYHLGRLDHHRRLPATSTRKARWKSRSTGLRRHGVRACRSTTTPTAIDVTGSYATRIYQAIIQYTFSHFSDNNTFVNLPYPSRTRRRPIQRSAAYSTPPSNDAHYLTVMLGANDVIPRTRVNLNARVGLEMQDDTVRAEHRRSLSSLPPATASSTNPCRERQPTPSTPSPRFTRSSSTRRRIRSPISRPTCSTASTAQRQLRTSTAFTARAAGMDATLAGSKPYAYVVPQDWLKQNAGFTSATASCPSPTPG